MRLLHPAVIAVLLALPFPAKAQDPLKSVVTDAPGQDHRLALLGDLRGGPLSLAAAVAGIPINYEAPQTPSQAIVQVNGLSVEDILNRLVAADPRLEWRMMRGMVVMRPREAWTDPRNPLNKRIARFSVTDVPLNEAIWQVLEAMGAPRLRGPNDLDGKARVTVAVTGETVLDVLNMLVESSQMSWRVRYERGNTYPLIGACSLDFRGVAFEHRIPPSAVK